MKILLLHNNYLLAGGEEVAFNNDKDLYKAMGYKVETFEYNYNDFKLNKFNKIRLGITAPFNKIIKKKLFKIIDEMDVDIFHIHNYFPFLSPPIIKKIINTGKPVLITLHNFRLFCINGIFLREGKLCTKCFDEDSFKHGIVNKCYKSSFIGSISISFFMKLFKRNSLLKNKNLHFIALSRFAKKLFLTEKKINKNNIHFRPNFIMNKTKKGEHSKKQALIVSRLSPEKGILELIQLWISKKIDYKLIIIGNGPLYDLIKNETKDYKNIEVCGYKNSKEVQSYMDDSKFFIFTTKTYENCPFTLLEAFSTGLPVISPDFGSVDELVINNINGLKFNNNSMESLFDCIQKLIKMNDNNYLEFVNKTYDYFINNFSFDAQINSSKKIIKHISTYEGPN